MDMDWLALHTSTPYKRIHKLRMMQRDLERKGEERA